MNTRVAGRLELPAESPILQVLDLSKHVDQKVRVKFNGGREVEGVRQDFTHTSIRTFMPRGF